MVYLSLGTNIGNRQHNLDTACRLIEEQVGPILRRSSIIETEPWGYDSENKYLNMCVAIETDLAPLQLLKTTQSIERQMGRRQKTQNNIYHDRIIDIDILLYNNLSIQTPKLIIPHPRMYERDFVMLPLREIMTQTEK